MNGKKARGQAGIGRPVPAFVVESEMIPLRDDVPSRTFPIVTILIIVANVLAFLFELGLGARLEGVLQLMGVLPVKYFAKGVVYEGQFHAFTLSDRAVPLFTSMFLHGGWIHLLGNMWYLWIFGDNVEDRLGHVKFLLFYLLAGVAASGVHIITNASSTVPTIGASGAIAGVLGAYLLLYPWARVLVLVPIFVFIEIVRVPALVVLGFWFVVQFFNGSLSLAVQTSATGGVAWWAHIGGFVAGMVLLGLFLAVFPSTRRRQSEYR
jgi:membrane associated rhomboid family serine protease